MMLFEEKIVYRGRVSCAANKCISEFKKLYADVRDKADEDEKLKKYYASLVCSDLLWLLFTENWQIKMKNTMDDTKKIYYPTVSVGEHARVYVGQEAIVSALNKHYGKTFTQSQISRSLKEVMNCLVEINGKHYCVVSGKIAGRTITGKNRRIFEIQDGVEINANHMYSVYQLVNCENGLDTIYDELINILSLNSLNFYDRIWYDTSEYEKGIKYPSTYYITANGEKTVDQAIDFLDKNFGDILYGIIAVTDSCFKIMFKVNADLWFKQRFYEKMVLEVINPNKDKYKY